MSIIYFVIKSKNTPDSAVSSGFGHIGPMHEENILGKRPEVPIASFSFSLLKVGI